MQVFKTLVEKTIKANVKRIAVTQKSIHAKMTEKDRHAKRVQERGASTMKILNLVEENQAEETKRIVNNKKSIGGMTQKYPTANRA